jgi:hypothetical protein
MPNHPNPAAERATIDAHVAALQVRRDELEQYERERRVRQDDAERVFLADEIAKLWSERDPEIAHEAAKSAFAAAVSHAVDSPTAENAAAILAAHIAYRLTAVVDAERYWLESRLSRLNKQRYTGNVPDYMLGQGLELATPTKEARPGVLTTLLDHFVTAKAKERHAQREAEISKLRESVK